MSEKNENIIVLEEKVALLINKLKQNYLDIKNLSEELENLSLIKKDLDKDLLFFKEESFFLAMLLSIIIFTGLTPYSSSAVVVCLYTC